MTVRTMMVGSILLIVAVSCTSESGTQFSDSEYDELLEYCLEGAEVGWDCLEVADAAASNIETGRYDKLCFLRAQKALITANLDEVGYSVRKNVTCDTAIQDGIDDGTISSQICVERMISTGAWRNFYWSEKNVDRLFNVCAPS